MSRQAGFTLVEIIVTMAISSMLILIAFVGQSELRSRAQFDASLDKLVATVADAHSQATAGVNGVGTGNGSQGCNGASATPSNVFAGVEWSMTDSGAGSTVVENFYKSDRTAARTCIFNTQTVTFTSAIRMNATPTPGQTRRLLFVRNDLGGLSVCASSSAVITSSEATFTNGVCQAPAALIPVSPAYTLNFSDANGHTSQVQIDSGGLAKRLN